MSGPTPDPPSGGEPTAAGDPEPGVLGSLPRTRPSVRSPRRARPAATAERPTGGETAEQEAPPEAAAEDEPEGPSREEEIEALARAGVSLAGEAATLGLRMAGRAAAALRDAVERS